MNKPWKKYLEGDTWHHEYQAWWRWAADSYIPGESWVEKAPQESVMTTYKQDHIPDLNRLPGELRICGWRSMDLRREWNDGEVILAAVPVCDDSRKPGGGFHYQLSVVTIRCDEDYFAVEEADEPWDWGLQDADFWLPLYR